MIATADRLTASHSGIAMIAKVQRALERATTIEEIRNVENLAQRAREYAKAAGMGRDSVNAAARYALDARRKAGATLNTMRERGELAERGKKQIYQRGILTLKDLDLTANQSSRYQKEASVPQSLYEKWVREVIASDDRMLTAAGLRALARQEDESPVSLAAAERRVGRLLTKLWNRMSAKDRACLPDLLASLSRQLRRLTISDCEKLTLRAPKRCKSQVPKRDDRKRKTLASQAKSDCFEHGVLKGPKKCGRG
jgi:hypothetical protein